MDDLRLLRHFEAVYRLMSFSAAASELRLTHSAVTKSIKALEADWGMPLFHRTTRTVAATEVGKKLYPHAVNLLAHAGSIRDLVSATEHEINIICGPIVLEQMVHPAVVKFLQLYPKARINAISLPPHLAAEELLQRRAHLLIFHTANLAGLPHRDRMRETTVVDEPYRLISRLGHPVGAGPHSLEVLVSHDWALPGYDRRFEDSLPDEFRKFLQNNGVPRHRLLSLTACIELVKHTDILTVAPESIAQTIAADERIATAPLPESFRFSVIAAELRDAKREPIVQHFIECI